MMKHGYTGKSEITDDHRVGKIVVNLTGGLNKCGMISPQFDAQLRDPEKWQNNLLPPVSLVSLYGQSQLASWAMRKHDENKRRKTLGFFF